MENQGLKARVTSKQKDSRLRMSLQKRVPHAMMERSFRELTSRDRETQKMYWCAAAVARMASAAGWERNMRSW